MVFYAYIKSSYSQNTNTMKTITILFMTLAVLELYAQDSTNKEPYKLNQEDLLYIDTIVEAEHLSKSQIFRLSQKWLAQGVDDSRSVKPFLDPAEDVILAKGRNDYRSNKSFSDASFEMQVSYNISIYIKEGKARLVIDDIAVAENGKAGLRSLENYYFTQNGKSKYGNNADKSKILETIQRIYRDWAVAVTKATREEYSDF